MKVPVSRFRILGPVLFYDLVCLARRRRYFILRVLFPLVLLILLFLVFHAGIERTIPAVGPFGLTVPSVPPPAVMMSGFAEKFFYWFMIVQFGSAVVFTPAYLAGAIAEDKDRRRVDFLFATQLESQEIILGRYLARVANLLCLLLAGLPVLSFVQLWGGIDPDLVLAGSAGVVLTVISIASFTLYQSVRAAKTRDALVASYLFLIAYFGFSLLAQVLQGNGYLAKLTITNWPAPITLGTLVRAFGAGNILVVRAELAEGINAGVRLSKMIPDQLLRYTVFHAVAALGFLGASIWQLRPFALSESKPARSTQKERRPLERWLHPGERPMLWKELYVDPGVSFKRVGRVLVWLIVLGSFLPAIWELGHAYWIEAFDPQARMYPGYWRDLLGQGVNSWVRNVGIAVACLTIVGGAMRAATSISGEREQETLDSLLASPLKVRAIVVAKWLGSLWSMRWGALWLCLVWAIGIVMGGLNLIILPWLVLAWLIYAGFFASLGIWFSVRTNKTLPAMVWTLGLTIALSVGQFVPWLLLGMPNQFASGFTSSWSLPLFQTYGMTPPMALGWLSFRGFDFRFFLSSEYDAWVILQSIILGLAFWSIGTLMILVRAGVRFQHSRGAHRTGHPDERAHILFNPEPAAAADL